MFSVNYCCCCFDLKQGFYTWGILSLVLRVTTIVLVYHADRLPVVRPEIHVLVTSMLPVMGYMIASTIALFIAMKGIVQERSILIYPYIVVLVCEVAVGIIGYLIAAIVISGMYFISMIFSGSVGIYILVCLLSLYKKIKVSEKNQRSDDINLPQRAETSKKLYPDNTHFEV